MPDYGYEIRVIKDDTVIVFMVAKDMKEAKSYKNILKKMYSEYDVRIVAI